MIIDSGLLARAFAAQSRPADIVVYAADVSKSSCRDPLVSSLKAVHRRIVDQILRYEGPYAYMDSLILDATCRIAVLPIEHQSRNAGNGSCFSCAACSCSCLGITCEYLGRAYLKLNHKPQFVIRNRTAPKQGP